MMKNLIKLATVIVLLTANSMNSQTTPKPSTSPSTTSVTVEKLSTSHSSSANDGKNRSSSILVKGTNSIYKFKASFNDNLTMKVRAFLQKELKKHQFTNTNNASFWTIIKNNEKVFECKVSKGVIRLVINKEISSKQFQKEIEEMGKELKYIISGENSENAKNL